MSKNASVARQRHSSLLVLWLHGHFWVIDQRLANVLVVDLIFLANAQVFNDRGARDLSHFAERIVVIVVGWAQVGLASGQSCLHLDIEETICHSEALLLPGEVFNLSLAGLEGRAEQAIALLVRLSFNSCQGLVMMLKFGFKKVNLQKWCNKLECALLVICNRFQLVSSLFLLIVFTSSVI